MHFYSVSSYHLSRNAVTAHVQHWPGRGYRVATLTHANPKIAPCRPTRAELGASDTMIGFGAGIWNLQVVNDAPSAIKRVKGGISIATAMLTWFQLPWTVTTTKPSIGYQVSG